jgi:hypothetical protein
VLCEAWNPKINTDNTKTVVLKKGDKLKGYKKGVLGEKR